MKTKTRKPKLTPAAGLVFIEASSPKRALRFLDYITVCVDHVPDARKNGFDGEELPAYAESRSYCHFCDTDND